MMNIATRFKYRIHLNCHDERQVGLDDACRDNSIRSNSYRPYPTLSKYRFLSLRENRHSQTDSSSNVSNCGCLRFFIPHWQADSRNKIDKNQAHYDRDVRIILEKWRSHSISTPVNHVEGLDNTAIPLYTNVFYNLAKVDPQQVTKSHVLDLESYSNVVELWHKFKRDKTIGKHNYPNVSSIYEQIVNLEKAHNNRVSEFMQQTETRILESINKECIDMKEIGTNALHRYYDISNIFKYFLTQPKKSLQIKNDRYEDTVICKRLFWEDGNLFIVTKTDEDTAEILKQIISDEYENISKTLKAFQEEIKIINRLANQFREQVSFAILCADNHGLKGKCIIGI
jgi:hypothetical protein